MTGNADKAADAIKHLEAENKKLDLRACREAAHVLDLQKQNADLLLALQEVNARAERAEQERDAMLPDMYTMIQRVQYAEKMQAESRRPVAANTGELSELEALRQEQAQRVMPLIGPLLDAYEGTQRGDLADQFPHLVRHLKAINFAMTDDRPTATSVGELLPKWAGEFKSFPDWATRAQEVLRSPSHRPAICIDTKGRRCAIGKDFMLARDEDAFPVRYFWECYRPTSKVASSQEGCK